ncbi:MAG: response regulator [bacterium]|nr:response regulator [bacterium]
MDKPTVLIIDDEELILSSFSAFLESDFHVLTASNGREGLLKFRSDPSLSMILLDLHMPEMNGVETLKAIRAFDEKIKIVVMTGNSNYEYAAQCADMNVQGYIQKPLDPDEILARMKKLIPVSEDNFFHHLWGNNYQDKLNSLSPLVRKMIELVDSKFPDNISREYIASKLEVSPNHLSKSFRNECGLQLSRYINERRIHESKKVLSRQERTTISQVARHIGVSDAHYFSKLFKKYTGVSPKDYVKKYKIS